MADVQKKKNNGITKAALYALACSLIFPIYYLHCFDSCSWFPWPAIVPGLHWVTVISGDYINIFSFIVFFLLFFATFYIAQKKSKSQKNLWLTVLIVWVAVNCVFAFTGILKTVDKIINEKTTSIKKLSDIENCNKYTLGATIKSIDLSDFEKGTNVLTLNQVSGNRFIPKYPANDYSTIQYNQLMNTEASKIQYLYSKFLDSEKREAQIKSDECYKEKGQDSRVLCFTENKLSLKLCPVTGNKAEDLSTILEYDKKAY